MDLLSKAGIGIRTATPADDRFIDLMWRRSGEQAWLERRWLPKPWSRLELYPESVRRAAYRGEISKLIREREPAVVAFVEETPKYIVGWVCPQFRWTRYEFRRQGISRILGDALTHGI